MSSAAFNFWISASVPIAANVQEYHKLLVTPRYLNVHVQSSVRSYKSHVNFVQVGDRPRYFFPANSLSKGQELTSFYRLMPACRLILATRFSAGMKSEINRVDVAAKPIGDSVCNATGLWVAEVLMFPLTLVNLRHLLDASAASQPRPPGPDSNTASNATPICRRH